MKPGQPEHKGDIIMSDGAWARIPLFKLGEIPIVGDYVILSIELDIATDEIVITYMETQ